MFTTVRHVLTPQDGVPQVWPHEFKDAEEAEVALLEALDDYNRHRIHSAIGYATPDEFAKR